ncbi:hypothetical protein ACFQ1A_19360 [Massilia pinisoli]|uniref:hypothetical protein n=1 Tax=Massilia pinisoli TaxID=1772194 RepID=UPI00362AFC4C
MPPWKYHEPSRTAEFENNRESVDIGTAIGPVAFADVPAAAPANRIGVLAHPCQNGKNGTGTIVPDIADGPLPQRKHTKNVKILAVLPKNKCF